MAYDERLAERTRDVLAEHGADLFERKMFGGLAFMLRGNMCVGIMGDELMVRVGPDTYAETLARPHARVMDFTGRPMKGFVIVSADGIKSAKGLRTWVERGTAHALSLPPK
jgi:TfoX/Sxy family transcriptional regulator of competence genes